MPRLLLAAPAVLGVLLLVLSAGAGLSACDTAVCESGALVVEDLTVGTGDTVTVTDSLLIAYVGRYEDGEIFDSATASEAELFLLAATIPGFRDGIAGIGVAPDSVAAMRVGGVRRLTIPPNLAYGDAGTADIRPCATLIFEVELLGIE